MTDTTPPAPHRAVELNITIGADDDDALVRALQSLINKIRVGDLSTKSVAGGAEFGWEYTVARDPAMTNERYFAAVDAYLAARQAAEQGAP